MPRYEETRACPGSPASFGGKPKVPGVTLAAGKAAAGGHGALWSCRPQSNDFWAAVSTRQGGEWGRWRGRCGPEVGGENISWAGGGWRGWPQVVGHWWCMTGHGGLHWRLYNQCPEAAVVRVETALQNEWWKGGRQLRVVIPHGSWRHFWAAVGS